MQRAVRYLSENGGEITVECSKLSTINLKYRRSLKMRASLLAAILTALLVGACGESDSTTSSRQPVNASAGGDFSATELTLVTLDGSASTGTGASYSWTQITGTPVVTILNHMEANASFIAPDISTDTLLTFQLTVTDDQGASDTAATQVTITSNPNAKSSGGSVVINSLRASRTSCVSPCSVIFSADNVADVRSTTDNDWLYLGYYWDYGDSGADASYGRFTTGADYHRGTDTSKAYYVPGTLGASRQFDTSPLGMHTYICDSGTCAYPAGLAVRNDIGDWATDRAIITVTAQTDAYPGTQTVCVSSAADYVGCPVGAQNVLALPTFGNWSNDTRYLIHGGETHDISGSCIEFDSQNILIDSYGGGQAILLGGFAIGADSACNDAVPNDAKVASYSNFYWVSDITVANVRIQSIKLNSSFRNIGFHNLDMDFRNDASGGGIQTSSTDYCTSGADLTCANVPLPYGVYISESNLVGSTTSPPKVNVGFWTSSGVSYVGMIGNSLDTADEHNARFEGTSRNVAIHNSFFGDHIGIAGNKHKITVRPEGYLNADMLNQMRVPTTNKADFYDSRYVYVGDNYFGDPDSVNNAAVVTIAPTNARAVEVIRWGVVDSNVVDLNGGTGGGTSAYDAALSGWSLGCYDNNDWQAPQRCRDDGQKSIPADSYDTAVTTASKPTAPLSPGSY